MTVFEIIKSKNIDELAEWIWQYGMQDFSPWDEWFGHKYCDKCETIVKIVDGLKMEYSWCELNNGKCKFFKEMNEIPWGKQLIKMWLESEDGNGV